MISNDEAIVCEWGAAGGPYGPGTLATCWLEDLPKQPLDRRGFHVVRMKGEVQKDGEGSGKGTGGDRRSRYGGDVPDRFIEEGLEKFRGITP